MGGSCDTNRVRTFSEDTVGEKTSPCGKNFVVWSYIKHTAG